MANGINVVRNLSSQDVITLVLVIFGTWFLLKLNKLLFNSISQRLSVENRYRFMALQPITRLIILVSGIVWTISILIVPTTENLITILGAAGLAIGFAFREYISSLIAGIVTLYEGPYRPGDWIEIGDVYGEVKAIGLRAMKILTADDVLVHIPLIKVWKSSIFNYNYGSTNLMSTTDVYIRPNQGISEQQLKRILYKVILSSPYTQVNKPIRVSMNNEIHGLKFTLKSYPVDPRDQFKYETDLSIKANEALRSVGIELTEFH